MLSSLGSNENCFVTNDTVSQEFSEAIDENLSILETKSFDYYFIFDGPQTFTISCEKQNLNLEQSTFLSRYRNDKNTFWDWAHFIIKNSKDNSQ